MKKAFSKVLLLVISINLFPAASLQAQQQIAALNRDGLKAVKPSEERRSVRDEHRAQINALQKRKTALRTYLSTLNPASADYQVTERAIQSLDAKLQILTTQMQSTSEQPAPSTPAQNNDVPVTVSNATPPAGSAKAGEKITITLGEQYPNSKAEIKIKVAPTTTGFVVNVKDDHGQQIYTRTYANLMRGVDDYTATVDLGHGENLITVSDMEGTTISNALILSGGVMRVAKASVVRQSPVSAPGNPCYASEINYEADALIASGKLAAADRATYLQTAPQSRLIGLLLGGSVISNQADNFTQADPFFGFITGYTSGRQCWLGSDTRFTIRAEGIFNVQPQAASAPEATAAASPEASPTPLDPTSFTPFLASRKTFDLDLQFILDRRIDPRFRFGFWGMAGFSTYVDKNEVRNDETITTNTGTDDRTQLDASRAQATNDVKSFYEGGFIGSFYSDSKLFMQGTTAYGNYEALKGLMPEHNTRHRFIGRLRVFPIGIDASPEGGSSLTPMFGVDLNAGRGPDQVKFFTGVAVAIKNFKVN